MKSCLHKVPTGDGERGTVWPEEWPLRLEKAPFWLNNLQAGIYGKQAAIDFTSDTDHWKRVVTKSYLTGLGINWSAVRNVMDMKAVYGGWGYFTLSHTFAYEYQSFCFLTFCGMVNSHRILHVGLA